MRGPAQNMPAAASAAGAGRHARLLTRLETLHREIVVECRGCAAPGVVARRGGRTKVRRFASGPIGPVRCRVRRRACGAPHHGPCAGGARWGNRTGRMFTGTGAATSSMPRCTAPDSRTSRRAFDRATGCACRGRSSRRPAAAHPGEQALPDELMRCSSWLDREVSALRNVRVVLALGSIGWGAALAHFARRGLQVPRPRRSSDMERRRRSRRAVLLGCYHVSQQNTNTRSSRRR